MGHGGLGAQALALALIVGSASAAPKPKGDEKQAWVMPHHSFERTLTYDDNLVHWFSSGATIALRNSVMLVPGVAKRTGVLWHRDLVKTGHYEAQFAFSVKGSNTIDKDEAFAFWITPENGTELFNEREVIAQPSWDEGLKKINHVFIGNRPKFHGLGVIFSSLDSTGKYRPSVSGLFNSGAGEATLTELRHAGKKAKFPVEKGVEDLGGAVKAESKFVNWRASSSKESPALFKIKVEPGEGDKKQVTGYLQLPGPAPHKLEDWIEIFRFAVDLPKQNYIGFTAATGSLGSQKPDELYLHSLQVRNFDGTVIGEDFGDVKDINEWLKVLEADKHYITQKSQSEAISKLTQLLDMHTKRFHVMGHRLQNSLVTVDTKIHALEEKTMVLKKEVQLAGMGGKEPPTDVAEMKNNIKGLKTIFSKDSHRHREHLEQVHTAVQTVKEAHKGKDHHAKLAFAATKAESLQKHAEASQTQHSWMMIIVFLVVIAIGFLILNRMKYYEKRHFL